MELQRELELLAERLQEAGGVSQAQVAMAMCAVSSSAHTHRRPLSRAGGSHLLSKSDSPRPIFGSRPSDHYFRSVCLFVCLFVCAVFSAVFDPISMKLGHMLHVSV